MEKLNKLFIENGFPAKDKFFSVAKKAGLNITRKDIDDFLNKQRTSQLHKVVKKKDKNPIVAPSENFEWQIDLLDMQKFSTKNKNNNWILISVDIFTRKAYAQPIKSKKPDDVLLGLSKIITQANDTPLIISSDNGKEFMGSLGRFLDKSKIIHRTADVGDHNKLGIIDRFSKTIKNMLFKYFTETGKGEWISMLPVFIKSYNEMEHGSLCGNTPNEAGRYTSDIGKCHSERVMKNKKNATQLSLGDNVRVRIATTKFSRGFEKIWSDAIYTIVAKEGLTYVLSNGKNKRANDLQLVSATSDLTIPKKDVVKKATAKKKQKNLLKRESIDVLNVRTGARTRVAPKKLNL